MPKQPFTAVIICLAACLLATTAVAQSSTANSYASIADIPAPLKSQITSYFGGPMYEEQYIDRVLMVIRQNGRDKTQLDQQDIDAVKTRLENSRRQIQFSQTLRYDRNFDGKVTRDEVAQTLTETYANLHNTLYTASHPEYIDKQVDNVMKLDTDHDGVISLKEMATLADPTQPFVYSRQQGTPANFLALDPNGDGKLTISELDALAHKAFNTVDTDHNGIITPDEGKLLQDEQKALNTQRILQARISPTCKLPQAGADEKVVYIGISEGKAVSSVTVAGQEAETDAVPVALAQGQDKIYLLLSSQKPVVWKISGDTSRIGHLVIAGPDDRKTGKITAGETGVDAKTVAFQNIRDCGLSNTSSSQQGMTDALINQLTGKTPDVEITQFALDSAGIHDGRITLNTGAIPAPEQKAPAGFDDETWKTHLRYMPGGLVTFKPADIVSDSGAENYDVLPKWAGISKLVHDGALVPIQGETNDVVITNPGGHTTTIIGVSNINIGSSNAHVELVKSLRGFKIVKNFGYFPPGLSGAGFIPQFILATGLKAPKGAPASSRIICEETNKPINEEATCD